MGSIFLDQSNCVDDDIQIFVLGDAFDLISIYCYWRRCDIFLPKSKIIFLVLFYIQSKKIIFTAIREGLNFFLVWTVIIIGYETNNCVIVRKFWHRAFPGRRFLVRRVGTEQKRSEDCTLRTAELVLTQSERSSPSRRCWPWRENKFTGGDSMGMSNEYFRIGWKAAMLHMYIIRVAPPLIYKQ